MFVQFVRGRVRDPEGVRRQFESWVNELMPDSIGFLGSTGGITATGELVAVARFESAESAAENASRPEEGAWWNAMLACCDGEPSVKESENVSVLPDHGNNGAGFVQMMEGSGDEAALRVLDEKFMALAADLRPDLLGGYRAFFGDGTFVDVAYFTNEAEARAAEAQVMPPDVAALFEELGTVVSGMTYHDISDPLII